MAIGIGSQKMNIPSIVDSHLYKGISIYSEQYKNAEKLKEKGAKVGEAPPKNKLAESRLTALLLL